MKYYWLFVFALLVTGCNRVKYIEFKGDMPGINSGELVIKDLNRNQLYAISIFDGKFDSKQILQTPGYYDLYITEDVNVDYKKHVYDVYLDGGIFGINAQAGKLYQYPDITSSSPIQNQLSDYYTLATGMMHNAQDRVTKLSDSLYGKNAPVVNSDAYNSLFDQFNKATDDMDHAQSKAFEDYVDAHPQNQVEAHILSEIDYKKDPVSYYRAYKKFTPEQKNSSDGRDEGDDLSLLAKLSPGAPAPKLLGKTPDGKPFDPATINKKVILVEFWRADNEVSRQHHQQLLNEYDSPLKNKDFTVVSVSLDTKAADWTNAIKQDKLTWTQLCDLKGENSPNMTNWGASTIPTYDLVDDNWHFIKLNIDFGDVDLDVSDYLKKPANQ